MILSNTVASAAVQGVTVNAAVDDNPVLGFSTVGNGRNWVGTPGSFNAAIAALGTPVASATINIDWTAGGYFTLTFPTSGTNVIQFATTATSALAAAAQVASFSLGQTIIIQWLGNASGVTNPTWPSNVTITWVGAGSAGPPTATTAQTTLIYLTCTGVGSSPTFTGLFLTN